MKTKKADKTANNNEDLFYITATYPSDVSPGYSTDDSAFNWIPIWLVAYGKGMAESVCKAVAEAFNGNEEGIAIDSYPASMWNETSQLQISRLIEKRYELIMAHRKDLFALFGHPEFEILFLKITEYAMEIHRTALRRAGLWEDDAPDDNCEIRVARNTDACEGIRTSGDEISAARESRCPPMSKAEMARRILNKPEARPREVQQLLKMHGLRHEGGNKWTIRLEGLEEGIVKRLMSAR